MAEALRGNLPQEESTVKRLHWVGIVSGTVLLCGLGAWIAARGAWPIAGGEPGPEAEEEAAPGGPPSAVAAPGPKLVIDQTEHQFGAVDPMMKVEHVYVVRNEGSAPLELTPGPTTCKCTLSDLPDRKVLPGKQGRIVVSL